MLAVLVHINSLYNMFNCNLFSFFQKKAECTIHGLLDSDRKSCETFGLPACGVNVHSIYSKKNKKKE